MPKFPNPYLPLHGGWTLSSGVLKPPTGTEYKPGDYLTVPQVAEALGISYDALSRALQKETTKAPAPAFEHWTRIGNRWCVRAHIALTPDVRYQETQK